MAEYMTTKEVARYLRLNEKKVYALVAEGQLPAARLSGKWLFPKHLVDRWVEENTVYPTSGLMDAVLEEMVVMQGSDDWLLSRVVEGYMGSEDRTVVSANVGSVAGLRAVAGGKAHLAGCHVDNRKVRDVACRDRGCHLVGLFERHQGIIYDAERHPGVRGLETIVERSMRFAERQPLSGTHRLVTSLFEERDLDITALPRVGPFSEHLGVALAVRTGQADAGVGIRVAAERCGLDFLPLTTERYKLAIPHRYFSQPRITGFLDHVLGAIRDEARKDPAGYDFDSTGRIETISSATAG